MKPVTYAILGDIHGNLHALNAVIEDARKLGASAFVCLGDIVGYNANPKECVDTVEGLDAVVVQGNHDYYCSHDITLHDFHPLAAEVIEWTRGQLRPGQVEYLKGLPLVRRFAGVTVVHSTLDMPERWGYVFDPLEAEAHFTYQTTPACVYGHTHVPVVFEKGSHITRQPFSRVKVQSGLKYFINVGSVGQPRDGDPRAAYALFDAVEQVFQLRRVVHDVDAAQASLRSAGLPERLALRLSAGR